jgi:hypothetical protein
MFALRSRFSPTILTPRQAEFHGKRNSRSKISINEINMRPTSRVTLEKQRHIRKEATSVVALEKVEVGD